MVKDCPSGHFEDVMAIDTDFFKHLEEVFPGRDIRAHNDDKLHNHGSDDQAWPRLGPHRGPDQSLQHDVRPVLHGREPGRLRHELTWDDIKTVLDNAITIKPRRRCQCSSPAASRRCSP